MNDEICDKYEGTQMRSIDLKCLEAYTSTFWSYLNYIVLYPPFKSTSELTDERKSFTIHTETIKIKFNVVKLNNSILGNYNTNDGVVYRLVVPSRILSQ